MLEYAVVTAADTVRIMEIIEGAKRSLAARGIDQWQRGYPNLESIENDLRRGVGRVGRIDGTIAVYGAAIGDGEPAYRIIKHGAWLSNIPYMVVHRLCTAVEYAHRGLASEFMGHVETEARDRGFGSFRIDTHPENNYMRQMLSSLGFVPCGEVWIESRRIAYEKILR